MRRYLVVDDNLAFAENLAEILRDAGSEVAVAESGLRALELARVTRFDAVVTDMRMPGMTGARLLHEIRRVDPSLPAIVVTAYTGESDLVAARQEGLLAVLPKPAPIEVLAGLLGAARRDGLVAVIDDDCALADNLTDALRERGFSTVTALSLAETDRLGGVHPFMALVDLRMPGGPDGAALRTLLGLFPDLPVVVMSGHRDAIARCDPPARFFFKPFETRKVLDLVEKLWH